MGNAVCQRKTHRSIGAAQGERYPTELSHGRFPGVQSEEAPSLAMKLKKINLRGSGPSGMDRPPAARVLLFPERHQARRPAGFGAAPLGAGGLGEAADRPGFVVVDVEDR